MAALKPKCEQAVGSTLNLFGIKATVVEVVPASDWWWEVTLVAANYQGDEERWTIEVPTDFETTTGHPAWME